MKRINYYKNKNVISLSGEEWRYIPDFEGYYQASNLGRIKSIDRVVPDGKGGERRVKERILSQFENEEEYLLVRFGRTNTRNSSCQLVSRMVAASFIPNPLNKRTVNHKKGNKKDNRAIELEWNTNQENNIHAFRELGRRSGTFGKTGKKCHSSKPVKCLNDKKIFVSIRDAAKYYGIDYAGIGMVCVGKQKSMRNGLRFSFIKK